MNTATILQAIDALDEARRALNCGGLDIPAQMQIALRCSRAAAALTVALEIECPIIRVTP